LSACPPALQNFFRFQQVGVCSSTPPLFFIGVVSSLSGVFHDDPKFCSFFHCAASFVLVFLARCLFAPKGFFLTNFISSPILSLTTVSYFPPAKCLSVPVSHARFSFECTTVFFFCNPLPGPFEYFYPPSRPVGFGSGRRPLGVTAAFFGLPLSSTRRSSLRDSFPVFLLSFFRRPRLSFSPERSLFCPHPLHPFTSSRSGLWACLPPFPPGAFNFFFFPSSLVPPQSGG